jgi:hypothetical protein
VLKTYALFDVIGVKRAFELGNAAAILDRFWTAADVWTNAGGHGMVDREGGRETQEADPSVVTFSDSALLQHEPEIEINHFWRLVRGLKKAIDAAAGTSYVVVCREHNIDHHSHPALGGLVVDSGGRPRYFNAGGSGPAFANLFSAEQAIRKSAQRLCNEYAVGPLSEPSGARRISTASFKGLGGRTFEVYGIG